MDTYTKGVLTVIAAALIMQLRTERWSTTPQ